MKYATLLLLTVLLFLSFPVARGQLSVSDGNDLLPRCKAFVDSSENPNWKDSHEAFSVGYCLGLVNGISFSAPDVCPTQGVTVLQEVRVVVKYLEDNPQILNLNGAMLTERALSRAFPCKIKKF
jgi:hypothetical protein